MGIAEADMFGVAGGMASCGKTVFANTFAMFSAGRCWERIRNGIAYPDLNVKVIGGHGGISIGQDGATHQCIEDFGLMRTIPGMTVVCPCDDHEMKCAVAALAEYPHTAYMRLGRMPVETVTDAVPGYRFELGKGAVLRGGSDATVIACGIMVQMALEAAEALQAEGLSVRVIDMHTIKPLDEELVLQAARETGAIVTAEEHNVKGRTRRGGMRGRDAEGAGARRAARRARLLRPLRPPRGASGGIRPHGTGAGSIRPQGCGKEEISSCTEGEKTARPAL